MRTPHLLLLALLTLPACAQAEELGRLFFTPQQRDQLDRQHAHHADDDGGSNGSSLTVNGIVQKNGGARTVWINGVPQTAGKGDKRDPASAQVAVPGQSKSVKIKVGQKLLLDNNPE